MSRRASRRRQPLTDLVFLALLVAVALAPVSVSGAASGIEVETAFGEPVEEAAGATVDAAVDAVVDAQVATGPGPVRAPRRIAALSPHLVEMLYALGVGERIVATVSHSDHPPAALDLPRVGDAFSLSLEVLASTRPELILAWGPALGGGRRARLETLDAPLWVSDPRRVEDVAEELSMLASLTGGDAGVARRFRAELAALRRVPLDADRDAAPVRVLPLVSLEPPMSVTDGQFLGGLIAHCGARNPVGEAPGAVVELSRERLLTVDADLVLLLTATPRIPDDLLLPAGVRTLRIDPDLFVRPGPRVLDGLRSLCAAVADLEAGA